MGYQLYKNETSDNRLNENCFLFLLHFYGSNGATNALRIKRVETSFCSNSLSRMMQDRNKVAILECRCRNFISLFGVERDRIEVIPKCREKEEGQMRKEKRRNCR